MRINHNIAALNTYRQLTSNIVNGSKSLEKLSSGMRINRAGDDAAGLSISEKMRGQIRGLEQAARNSQDAISMIQTAEGALNETHSILQRMRELAVQSASDTNTSTDRTAINTEISQLNSEVDRIAQQTEYNNKQLLNGNLGGSVDQAVASTTALGVSGVATVSTNGAFSGTYTISATATGAVTMSNGTSTQTMTVTSGAQTMNFSLFGITITTNSNYSGGTALQAKNVVVISGSATFQIGANADQNITLAINDMSASGVGTNAIDVTTQSGANTAIGTLNTAIGTVSTERSKLGAYQNRLEHTINNLNTSSENLQASESRIRDVDMAKEMMEFTKNNILSQAAQAMLAQANQQPQGVLQLLR